MMTHHEAAKLMKAELTVQVANHVALQPVYAGHYADAIAFVKHHYRTKKALLLTGACRGLWGFEPY